MSTKTKEVTCVDRKTYRLTVGNTYTVKESKRKGFYDLENDAGREVSYATDLFQDVPEESTTDQIIESITASADPEARELQIQYNNGGQQQTVNLNGLLSVSGTNISCGISQVYGLNGLTSALSRQFQDHEDAQRIREAMFACALETWMRAMDETGFIILSTNQNDDNFSIASEYLNSVSANTISTVNPNSDNTIVMWTVDAVEQFAE